MSEDRKKIYPEGSGPDGIVTEGDDLRPHVKATLKDYLKGLTKRNSFTIKHDSEKEPETGELKSNDPERSIYPSSEDEPHVSTMIYGNEKNSDSFVNMEVSSAESIELAKISDSGKFTDLKEPTSTLRTFFDKTKRGQGHKLLKDIESNASIYHRYEVNEKGKKEIVTDPNTSPFKSDPTSAPEAQKRISKILTSNRFSPSGESPYMVAGEDGGMSIPKAQFGVVGSSLGRNSLNTPEAEVAIDDLRKIGLELIQRQTGVPPRINNAEMSDPINQLAVIAGAGFFDNTIPKSALRAKDTSAGKKILGDRPEININIEDVSPDDSDTTRIAARSQGAAFSHLETFTTNSLAHATMILQGLFGTMTLGIVMGIFLELLYGEVEDDRARGADPANLTLGRNTDTPEAHLAQHGVPYLKYPVFNSIAAGLLALFRLKWSKRPEKGLFGFLSNFVTLMAWFALTLLTSIPDFINALGPNKGFYVILVRQAMRDGNHFSKLFGDNPMALVMDLMKEMALAAITGGGTMRVLLAFLGLFNHLASFKFFMTVAVIGDKCYEGHIADFSGLHVPLELLPDNGQTRVYKSRVNRISNALAWRHRSAPSMMYMPHNSVMGVEQYSGATNAAALVTALSKVGDFEGTEAGRRTFVFAGGKTNPKRISPDDVLAMENLLESEYMPFYFHDLRTNEIISFHAFIADFKDSFAPEYSDTTAIGRLDPVKIYKRTTRSINLTFYIVSTSEEDFDSMWLSVNKLVNMVYPQWSKGRIVKSANNEFIMPNSQIMTASPMIRLRIGDFVRGNGGKYNIAKLFGVEEPAEPGKFDHKLKAETFKDAASIAAAVGKAAEPYKIHADEAKKKAQIVSGKLYMLRRSTTHGYTAKPEDKPGLPFMIPADPPLFKIWTRADAVVEVVKVSERPGGTSYKDVTSEDSRYIAKTPTQVEVKFKESNDPANPFANTGNAAASMFVLPSDLIPIVDETGANAAKVAGQLSINDLESAKFFTAQDAAGNAIHKAAATTRGRGLAGFITSLDFDYSEATYETATLTRRAPKMIKISMAFTPIHDIAPGMDHNGGFRAPLYPVGDIMAHLSQDELRNVEAFGIDPATVPNTVMGKKEVDPKALKLATETYMTEEKEKIVMNTVTSPSTQFRADQSSMVKVKDMEDKG